MDKMREAFEEHAYCWAASFTRSEEEYCDDEVNSAWLYFKAGAAWQAAQSAAVPVVGEVVAEITEDGALEPTIDGLMKLRAGMKLIVQPATSISAAELERLQRCEKLLIQVRDDGRIKMSREFLAEIDAAIAGEK